jgi:hypothetical protein
MRIASHLAHREGIASLCGATAHSFPSDRSGLPDSLWHRVHLCCLQNPSRRFGSQFQALQITPTIRVDRDIVINKTLACRGHNVGRFHAAGSIPRTCHSGLLTYFVASNLNAIWTLGLKLVDTSPEEQLEGYLDNSATPQRHRSTLSAENNNGNGNVPLRDYSCARCTELRYFSIA